MLLRSAEGKPCFASISPRHAPRDGAGWGGGSIRGFAEGRTLGESLAAWASLRGFRVRMFDLAKANRPSRFFCSVQGSNAYPELPCTGLTTMQGSCAYTWNLPCTWAAAVWGGCSYPIPTLYIWQL